MSRSKTLMHLEKYIYLFGAGEGLLSFFTSGSSSESGLSCLTVSELDFFEL